MFTIGLYPYELAFCGYTAYAPRRVTIKGKKLCESTVEMLGLFYSFPAIPPLLSTSHNAMDTTTAVSGFEHKLFTDSQDSIMVRRGEGLVWSFSSPGLGPKKVVEKLSNDPFLFNP